VTTLYISPERFYALATPPALLFSTEDDVPTPLLPGSISDIVQTVGAGAGKALIGLAGNPMGTFSVVVVCTAGGQINELGVVNLGSLPAFKLSVNAGVTFGRSRTVSVNDDRAYIDVISGPVSATSGGAIGLRIIALPGIFAVGDTFAATTAPSPDLVSLIPPMCDFVDGYLVGSWGATLPLTAWGEDLEQTVADLVRWRAIQKAGLASREDMERYHPDKTGATKWLMRAQSGEFANHPAYIPSLKRGTGTPDRNFPLMVPPFDPLSGMLI